MIMTRLRGLLFGLCMVFLLAWTVNSAFAAGISAAISGGIGSFPPGTNITIEITPDLGTTISKVWIVTGQEVQEIAGPPWIANVTIPNETVGSFPLCALARTPAGVIYKDLVNVNVIPLQSLTSLEVDPDKLLLLPGELNTISVYGIYEDGTRRRLQGLVTGTTFSSSSPMVVSVDENGLLRAFKSGSSIITVKNGDKQNSVEAQVVPSIGPMAGPVACAGGPYKGVTSVTLSLDASCSVAAGSNLVKYEWDWNNDGRYDEVSMSSTVSHMWITPYEDVVGLRVTDKSGASSVGSALVQIQPRMSMTSAGAYFLMNGYRGIVTANTAYPYGSATPSGWVRFSYHSNTITVNLISTSIQSLDQAGLTSVTVKGVATVNGQSGYSFVMSVTDGGSPGTKKDILSIDIVDPDGSHFFGAPPMTLSGGDLLVSVK